MKTSEQQAAYDRAESTLAESDYCLHPVVSAGIAGVSVALSYVSMPLAILVASPIAITVFRGLQRKNQVDRDRKIGGY